MKSLTNYIQSINEHFVNCKNEDEMHKYGDIVWSILQKAYEYCGGIKNVNNVDDLIKDTHLWKLYRKNNEIKAVICYTDRKGGRKLCLLGQDGSDEGRKMLKKMMEDDFRLTDRQSWVGVSGKAAITALKHGGIPVPAEIAVKYMGKKCEPYDEYWYNRPIKNSDGEIEKLNLKESFILWAKGQTWADATGSGYYWRGGIDYATANISEEDMPQNVSWYDIVEYIDRKSVKADRVSTWRKSDEEINADKAQKRKEAEEKRMARSETADRLFDKYLHEGLSPELSAKVEAEYNRRFNSYIIPDYSKLPLFIDGMSREKDGKKF